ncbi:polyketide synthase PksF [Stachybotrys elegans]|uniref:Polyketide synthase PksF n=1 Tax=Stachybotrys elegans TaxID=80388 RepID=A0A8K0SW00_9HYPO|nr:polyketide synthase PksF [Stachybotrys elegans]
MAKTVSSPKEPIAVVGSGCRFAGDVSTPSALWDLLRNPKDVQSEIPRERFNARSFYHENNAHHGHANVKHSYLLQDDVAAFDAEFFGIKPIEAQAIDPQQRLLMETVYESLESAGLSLESLRGSDTSVYVGVMCYDYEALQLRDLQETPTYMATGTGHSILSNRLSYIFDWHGPSITLDTACSSSLVAVHMAVQTLRAGDSKVAVACGSNLQLGPENFILESKLKMLSPDGRSRMWDADANGYARGDGVAAVVLKTLSQAIADGDHIECLIRETGLNQDGATTGITMPSSVAQKALIHSTYARAGLDLNVTEDRPQFFEAHGTGTPAGDPIEAEAIAKAFFGDEMTPRPDISHPLYVGSIKTVLGHTEGTAGIAALLKASLALQNSTIPPNLLFNRLSESVAPFYSNLEIATIAKPWPATAVRRASVNSFGFGGANAHAIIENYNSDSGAAYPLSGEAIFSPFVFSATSERSLRETLAAYAEFLDKHPDTSAQDLAYTLRHRRTVFPIRAQFSVDSLGDLQSQILSSLERGDFATRALAASKRESPKLLGVFTGQGAQYGRMGAELIEKSSAARKVIQELESHLAGLPGADRPRWSLQAEILADAKTSRVAEAAIAQPLCTAVQIVVVDLLKAAGVGFSAVVGHSSGEIAAAYAAGYLTARDAIVIAYYRGLRVGLAASPNGAEIKGAMMALGTSMEDAEDLCSMDEFAGRVAVAASNSPSSVTVSGDEDAIDQLQVIAEEENMFNRKLRVDRAYHSAHMLPCRDSYIDSIRASGVKALQPSSSNCTWFSSVYNKPVSQDNIDSLGLSDVYWAENMTRPVLFSQAITTALLSGTAFDVAIEVGPHAALKGPASQTIQEVLQKEIPYTGTLARGNSSVRSMASCLGFLWTRLDKQSIDLEAYSNAASPRFNTLLKGLPSYQWSHEARHWHESRRSRKMRLRDELPHHLLGDADADSSPHAYRWRNLLRISEMEWLSGHRVQDQTVFPAAGYMATALEAAMAVARGAGKTVALVEVENFYIHQAVAFNESEAGIEVLVSLHNIDRSLPGKITASFTYSAHADDSDNLTLAASASVTILLGKESPSLFAQRPPMAPHTIALDSERFYTSLADLGYEFTGPFQSLTNLRRKHNFSTVAARLLTEEDVKDASELLIHPAELDASFQAMILAAAYPYDDMLRTIHLPTSIERIRFNPAVLASSRAADSTQYAAVDASLRTSTGHPDQEGQGGYTGDCTVYFPASPHAAIQVQGVTMLPLGALTSKDDRKVFTTTHWVKSSPDLDAASAATRTRQEHREMVSMLERISTFYLAKFDALVPDESPFRVIGDPDNDAFGYYLNFARHTTEMVKRGEHPWVKKEWLDDSPEELMRASDEHEQKYPLLTPDIKIMHLVGQQMPRVFRGETTMIQEFRESGLLDGYYANGYGFTHMTKWMSNVLAELALKDPHMNILEVGAGTGGATRSILPALANDFQTYTFTDVSSAFFENAEGVFAEWKERMRYKVFDLERDPLEQGYVEGSYDVVVGSLVVHATAELEKTMRNIRRLLKPGGWLVISEGSDTCSTGGFIFGPLSGWWLGFPEGRELTPMVPREHWDRILRKTGFSGVDSVTPYDQETVYGVMCWAAQAVDDQISFLREPLGASTIPSIGTMKHAVIVGGKTSETAGLVQGLKSMLDKIAPTTSTYKSLADVDYSLMNEETAVISLVDLDEPILRDPTPESWSHIKAMFTSGKTLLWVTTGREDINQLPHTDMTIGFGRAARYETDDLHLQFIDVPEPSTALEIIASSLVRLHAASKIPEDKKKGLLWPVETELIVDKGGRLLVPRLRPATELNDRYNSKSRPITRDVDIRETRTSLLRTSAGEYAAKEIPGFAAAATGSLELRVEKSLVSAIKTRVGHLFLVVGEDKNEPGAKYLAFTDRLLSLLDVAPGSAVKLPSETADTDVLLNLAAAYIVAEAIISTVASGQTLLVHNAPSLVAQAIEFSSGGNAVGRVLYTMDEDGELAVPNGLTCIKLPPYISHVDIENVLPPLSSLGSVTGLSNHVLRPSFNEKTLLASLPGHVRRESSETLFSRTGHCAVDASSSASVLKDTLEKAVRFVAAASSTAPPSTIQLLDLLDGGNKDELDPATVIDWSSAPSQLSARVSRLDSSPMFLPDKTYWMVGLSGALGISLVDWAITRGARYLVVTSRNPHISSEWIDNHAKNGVVVSAMACDVTDEPRLKALYQQIVDSMPPIQGVLNGAMVLRDVTIANMSFTDLVTVTRPKVLGSTYLDRIFRSHPHTLDWFIMFSSVNCIIGNTGQANYAAANSFMCALAAKRRREGLPGVALNIGAIIGAGYMERESSKTLDLAVAKMAMMHLSEEDYHQIFVEGVAAAPADSTYGPELTTGLLDVPMNAAGGPPWVADPKFGSLLVHSNGDNGDDDGAQASAASLQDQLKACKNRSQLFDLIQERFAVQLRKMLQMTTPDEELMGMRSSEIGLDSLVSVDIRGWFLKNFKVGIPVLKIMGNEAMSSLVQHAAESMSAELLPGLEDQPSEEADSPIAPDGSVSKDTLPSATATSSVEDAQSEGSTPRTPLSGTIDSEQSYRRNKVYLLHDGSIDYAQECAPPADFAYLADAAHGLPPPKSQPEVIVLTGATGLLGHHLLSHLLSLPSVKKVICLAVRRLPSRLASGRLPAPSSRVEYYEGELSLPGLGLSEASAESIFAEADAVIHNGADTSHLKYYAAMLAPNVLSTQFLARACLPRRIPIHYVSTVGVGMLSPGGRKDDFRPGPTGEAPPPADGSHGYAASKWVCEHFLETLSLQHGLPVCVHRPSTILREGADAEGVEAQMDWINALIDYSRRLQAVPRVTRTVGSLDFVTIKSIVRDINGAVLQGPVDAKKPRYFHNVGDVVMSLQTLQESIHLLDDSETGVGGKGKTQYRVMKMDDWVDASTVEGLHPAVASLIEMLEERDIIFPRLLRA